MKRAFFESRTDAKKLLETDDLQKRLRRIKVLLLDVDGILTDGHVFYLDGHGWCRNFHVHDGHGIKMLVRAGIEVGVLSGGESNDVKHRMEMLGARYIYLGNEDKLAGYEKVKEFTGCKDEEIAFMGDDVFDLPVLEKVGFSATVPHAMEEVRAKVHYVTEIPGGYGAVREVADAIRKAKGL